MTDRIDLTENRDFRGPSDFTISRIIAEETLELANERSMSTDEFEKVYAWEQMFGKQQHVNEKEIFVDYDKWREKEKSRCQRCGKIIKFPWRQRYELCEQCDERISYQKIPWEIVEPVRYRDMEIFSLR